MELTGRTAVVTGAASGIGLALTERFLDDGMSVVMADVEADALSMQAKRIADKGGNVMTEVCDVSDPDQVVALREAALGAFGAVHLLCNNAGVSSGTGILRTKPDVWKWIVGVNLLGVAYGCTTFAPLMVEQGVGHIVNTSSEAGLCASPTVGAYHAAKYGVVGLSESLSMELSGTGVGVSCLCPELVGTRIFSSSRNAPSSLGWGAPQEITADDVAAFLGSPPMPAAHVAAEVAYAVRADRFWILSHDKTLAKVRHRNDALETLRTPTWTAG